MLGERAKLDKAESENWDPSLLTFETNDDFTKAKRTAFCFLIPVVLIHFCDPRTFGSEAFMAFCMFIALMVMMYGYVITEVIDVKSYGAKPQEPKEGELILLSRNIFASVSQRGLLDALEAPLKDVKKIVETSHRLEETIEKYNAHLATGKTTTVQNDLRELVAKIPAASDATQPILIQNKELLEMRLEKLRAIEVSREVALAQRRVMMDTLKLLNDQMLVAVSHDELRAPLQHLTAIVKTTDSILSASQGLLATA